MKTRLCISIIAGFILSTIGFSQELPTIPDSINVLKRIIIEDDTLYIANMEEVYIFPQKKFRSYWHARRYRRLIKNVKKAYPYAKMASAMLDQVNANMSQINSERKRKEYIKQVEKDIRDRYEDELKGLTISQGKILILLIDRETGDTSYELVKELRGSFSAFFWQALARIFGSNLKTEYEPEGRDRIIEEIVQMIERGQIQINY